MVISLANVTTPAALAGAATGKPVAGSQQIDNWNEYYGSVVETAYRFLGAFVVIIAVLYVSSGLVSGLLVQVDAPVWRERPLNFARWLGPALIFAAAALLPCYAMFHPTDFANIRTADTASASILLGVFVLVVLVFLRSQWGGDTSARENRHGPLREPVSTIWKHWWQLLTSLFVIFTSGIILWFVGLQDPHQRLVMIYVDLVLLSVVTTSVSFGQSRRIQISAKTRTGKHDEAATEYLLVRMTTLGLEQPRLLQAPLSTKALSHLNSSDLSASPAGQFASAMARVLFAIRPGLAWHAAVTFVDNGRIAMTLSRNGRLAKTDGFIREDVFLSPIDEKDRKAVDRARAQMLTGAAAFALLHLGKIYPEMREGMCGAQEWRSVALQIIACSASLAGREDSPDSEDATKLLFRASNLDPENYLAEFWYIRYRMRDEGISIMAKALLLKRLDTLREQITKPGKPPKEYETLQFRINYISAFFWLDIALECNHGADKRDRAAYLKNSLTSTEILIDLCKDGTAPASSSRTDVAKKYKDTALCLRAINGAVSGTDTSNRPANEQNGSPPATAYNYACFEAERLASWKLNDGERTAVRQLMLDDLAFSTGTNYYRNTARSDQCFKQVRKDRDFIAVVGPTPIPEFLGLDPYKNFTGELEKIGFDSAQRFATANGRPEQRAETAAYLGVPSAAVDQMYEFAVIGELIPELADAKMLYLLLKLEIYSWTRLHEEIDRDRGQFVEKLRKVAADSDLEELLTVKAPDGWLSDVAATSHQAA